jgi:hypothetical protein
VEEIIVECEITSREKVAERVGRAVLELRALQEPLLAGEVIRRY